MPVAVDMRPVRQPIPLETPAPGTEHIIDLSPVETNDETGGKRFLPPEHMLETEDERTEAKPEALPTTEAAETAEKFSQGLRRRVVRWVGHIASKGNRPAAKETPAATSHTDASQAGEQAPNQAVAVDTSPSTVADVMRRHDSVSQNLSLLRGNLESARGRMISLAAHPQATSLEDRERVLTEYDAARNALSAAMTRDLPATLDREAATANFENAERQRLQGDFEEVHAQREERTNELGKRVALAVTLSDARDRYASARASLDTEHLAITPGDQPDALDRIETARIAYEKAYAAMVDAELANMQRHTGGLSGEQLSAERAQIAQAEDRALGSAYEARLQAAAARREPEVDRPAISLDQEQEGQPNQTTQGPGLEESVREPQPEVAPSAPAKPSVLDRLRRRVGLAPKREEARIDLRVVDALTVARDDYLTASRRGDQLEIVRRYTDYDAAVEDYLADFARVLKSNGSSDSYVAAALERRRFGIYGELNRHARDEGETAQSAAA